MRHAHRLGFVLAILFSVVSRAAIPVAADAYTDHDYGKAMLAFNRRALHDVYAKSGKKNPKWDALVLKLFDGMAIRHANFRAEQVYRLPDEPPPPELMARAQAAIDAGCDDPLVRYCLAALQQEQNRPAAELMPAMEQLAAELTASAEPSWRGVWAQHRICRLIGADDPAGRANHWERFKDVAIDLIVRWKYQDIDARIIYEQIWMTLESEGPDYQQAFVKALNAKKGGDPWLREMILGSADVKAAWHYRGGGWANTVTDGGWAGFNRHLDQARDHLTAAWKLQPKFPEAAAEMITVAMGAGDRLGESDRAWFDRAVAAQFDYAPAYASFLWASRPRWGGTIGKMYDFGVECAQTKRYDTRVPRFLLRALDDIASDMNGPQFWRQPGVYEQVKELYDGLAGETAKRKVPEESDKLRSEQAAFAWRVQRYDEARIILDEQGDHFYRGAFERYGAMGMLAASHAYAMRPGLSDAINEAERQATQNQIDVARASYESALAKLDANDKAAFFLKSRIRQLQWQKQFDAGEWVDIQPTKDFAGWSPQAGKWEVDEQGGVVGTFLTRQLTWLPCQGQFVHGSFVVEGNVELLDEGKNCSAGVGMTYDSLDRIYGLYFQRDARRGSTVLRRDFWPGAQDAIALQPKNKFSFTFAAGRAGANVNDKEIFRDYDVSYMWQASRSYLGIGGRWGEPGSRMRFTNLRIRAVNNPAPVAAEPAAQPEAAPAPAPAPQE
ncbi:MAG: hypothetical protein QOF78_2414 [Phycisphaerales bacterium]|jgi:hypothetical protein|nr:hypothetical protein [Phycisphaerales bacterium]